MNFEFAVIYGDIFTQDEISSFIVIVHHNFYSSKSNTIEILPPLTAIPVLTCVRYGFIRDPLSFIISSTARPKAVSHA